MKKQVLVSVDRAETRVALLEATGTVASSKPAPARGRRRRKTGNPGAGYRVGELYLERRGARSIVGNIYKGRVDNVLAGLEAAFVDIGLEKNGFLHVDEIVLPGVESPRRGRGSGREGRQIADLLKPGQEVVVQVVKDPLRTKGPRLSMELTIAGRYMVYAPLGEGVGVSRRLDEKERERLRKEASKLDLKGAGVIIRTAAQGATRADLERELLYLFKLGEVLQKRVEETTAPALVFQEADLSVRVVRDIFSSEFERAYVDDPKQYHRLVSFFTRTAPDLVDRVELWDSDEPLFEAFGVEKVLDSTLSRRIDLPSGGYLVIDYAEALTVIDVNTGSFIGRGRGARLEDTITKTNLEAADEVVRQLRLRDIGGIIVIDFIDMARARNRDAVLKALRAALDEDRTKTFVVEISPLGLVEMTRQNVTDGVREIMTRPCPTCGGEGVIKSEETLANEFERRMRDLAKETKAEALLIQMNPRVSAEFTRDEARALQAVEHDTGKVFVFEGSEGLPLDHFSVVLESSRDDVLERAVPFRVGEEVHVEVVEPHMYSPGDAVAKVDGYVITIVGGGPYVGEKHLVRIEEAGRTAATATLVDVTPSAEAELVSAHASGRSRGSGAGSRSSGAGSRGSGAGSRSSGAGSRGSGAGSRSSGAGSRGSGPGSRSSGAASRGSGAGSRSSASGSRSSGTGSRSSGTGSRSSRRGSGRARSANSRDGGAEAEASSSDSGTESGAASGAVADVGGAGSDARDASGAADDGSRAAGDASRAAGDASGAAGDASGAAGDAASPGAASETADNGLQSKPRRRGRRGGRRRSGAKAESASTGSSSSSD